MKRARGVDFKIRQNSGGSQAEIDQVEADSQPMQWRQTWIMQRQIASQFSGGGGRQPANAVKADMDQVEAEGRQRANATEADSQPMQWTRGGRQESSGGRQPDQPANEKEANRDQVESDRDLQL